MQGQNIDVAREALRVFMQSLPADCYFSIISFGSSWELHKRFGDMQSETGAWKYSEEVLDKALADIANFQADFGGT